MISLEDFSDTTEVIILPCRHAFTDQKKGLNGLLLV
jgi:hypothetical protein